MKTKDWQKATHMVWERQSQTGVPNTFELSSLSLSQLLTDESGPPVVVHGIDAPLSTSTLVQAHVSNQQSTKMIQEETSFRQVLANIPQQSLYPSSAAMGTSINTSVSPAIPFSQKVIKDSKNCQRMLFSDTVWGAHRGIITSPILGPTKQQDAKRSLRHC